MKFSTILITLLSLTSCATILSGSKQEVTFTSNMPDAKVYANGSYIGSTSVLAKIKKQKLNMVEFRHEERAINIELKGKFIGTYLIVNSIFGGAVLGWIVDGATHAWLKYPRTLHVDFPALSPLSSPQVDVVAATMPASTSRTEVDNISSLTQSSNSAIPVSEVSESKLIANALRPGSTPFETSGKSVTQTSTFTNNSPKAPNTSPQNTDDPFGLNLKKLILGQLFDELPKKGMPSANFPTDSSIVYTFFVGKRNVTTYITNLLAVRKYSDDTWPSTRDTKQRFATQVGLPLEKIAFVGFFDDSLLAKEAWNTFINKATAYEINRVPVDFSIEPDLTVPTFQNTALASGSTSVKSQSRETKVINLPDLNVTLKYRPSIGIMPIIDTETNLNQQFLVNQYLIDNPVILNGKDTLQSSLTDYRSYTQYALGGSMDKNAYTLKLWQKEKLLAEIYIGINEKTTLEDRMTRMARELGRVLSGNTSNYVIQSSIRTRNLIDASETIQGEIRKSTQISALFPDATTQYLPPNFNLPSQISYLAPRLNNKPYLPYQSANIMAQLVRGIYQQADEKQFFFTNSNIPQEMKEAVRKITQPTSRRIGSALSYVAVGDAFLNNENNLDGAASAYYSALLLAHNLAASPMEKASVKQLVYARMKRIAETRKQTYLASLFEMAEDLNASFLQSAFAQASHQEYYSILKQSAIVCLNIEQQARDVRTQARFSAFSQIALAAGSVAQATQGKTFSNAEMHQLENQLKSFAMPALNAKVAMAENMVDITYEKFTLKDESGTEIELNKFYLNIEVMGHLALRQDQTTVAKRLLDYAADKPNLRLALEEYLAETDSTQQANAINEFQNLFKGIEAQVNSYESWGKKLPKKVLGKF